MLILHIITSLENGGAEALLDTLVRADKENEHVVVSLYTEGFYGPGLKEQGVTVYSLDMPRSRLTVKGILKLYRIIRRYRSAVVHTWMYHANFLGGIVCRLAGQRRIVWSLHNAYMDPKGTSRSLQICNTLCARMSGWLPASIMHSSKSGADLHIGLGYNKDKMAVVPGGYNLNKFVADSESRHRIRQELQIADSTRLVGMIARWNPQKDHPNLIKALSQIDTSLQNHMKVLLVGDGMQSDNQPLVDVLNEYKLMDLVMLLGPRRDVPALMNALDLHVLSSSFGESFPNVVNESMACGVPSVVTDVGDSGYIVGDTGWVVPPKDPEALAMAMNEALSMMADSSSWSARQQASSDRVRNNFSIESMTAQYQRLWEAAAAR